MEDDIKKLLKEAEERLPKLMSVRRMEAIVRCNPSAYDMRVEALLETMNLHLKKLLSQSKPKKNE